MTAAIVIGSDWPAGIGPETMLLGLPLLRRQVLAAGRAGFQRLADGHPNVPKYRYQLALSRHRLADAIAGRGAVGEREYHAALKEHQP